jgi:hypothetical protein
MDIGMPHQFLYSSQVTSAHNPLAHAKMPQIIKADPFKAAFVSPSENDKLQIFV